MFKTEDIVGYPVCCETTAAIIERLIGLVRCKHRPGLYFGCLNPHSIEVAAGDPEFESALLDADFLTADGIGIVIASRFMGGSIRGRITGTDVFTNLTRAMNEQGGMSCFFLGSTDATLKSIRERMAREFPKVRVSGTYSPPFKPVFDPADTEDMIRHVNDSAADVLWVGMTAPKQEKWIYRNRYRLNVAFSGPIGAVFDFYAGNIKRAGPVWQSLGLEWLPRFVQEPRRLWRRNLISAPSFFVRSVRYRLSKSGSGRSD